MTYRIKIVLNHLGYGDQRRAPFLVKFSPLDRHSSRPGNAQSFERTVLAVCARLIFHARTHARTAGKTSTSRARWIISTALSAPRQLSVRLSVMFLSTEAKLNLPSNENTCKTLCVNVYSTVQQIYV